MVLSVNELKKTKQNRHKQNKQLYKEILEHIYMKIQNKNSQGYTSLVYMISPVALGKPLINVAHATTYVSRKLIQGQFKINVIHNKIHIDWS